MLPSECPICNSWLCSIFIFVRQFIQLIAGRSRPLQSAEGEYLTWLIFNAIYYGFSVSSSALLRCFQALLTSCRPCTPPSSFFLSTTITPFRIYTRETLNPRNRKVTSDQEAHSRQPLVIFLSPYRPVRARSILNQWYLRIGHSACSILGELSTHQTSRKQTQTWKKRTVRVGVLSFLLSRYYTRTFFFDGHVTWTRNTD